MKFYLKNWFILLLLIASTSLFFVIIFLSDATTKLEYLAAKTQLPNQNSAIKEGGNVLGFKAGAPSRGNKNAPVKVIEFSDFECPFCREAFLVLKDFLPQHEDEIFFQYRHFPISQIHPFAVRVAEASMCADEQGKFWDYHDLIFENQNFLNDAFIRSFIDTLKLNSKQFTECLESNKYALEVQNDFNDGRRLGVNATPTFFINGRKISGVLPKETWEQLIKELRQ
jgi:protein-disulfide isomerase